MEPRIEEETEYEIIDTSIADSESLKILLIVWQVTLSISSSSKFKEFPSIHQVPDKYNDVISFAVIDVHPPRESIYFFLGILPLEFVALHLHIMYNKISKQIATCNDWYKFIVYPHNILQKFVVDNGWKFQFSLGGSFQELHSTYKFIWRFKEDCIHYLQPGYFVKSLYRPLPMQIYHHLKLVHHISQFSLHHLNSDVMCKLQFHEHHHGPIGMLLQSILISSTWTHLIFFISTFIKSNGLKHGALMEIKFDMIEFYLISLDFENIWFYLILKGLC